MTERRGWLRQRLPLAGEPDPTSTPVPTGVGATLAGAPSVPPSGPPSAPEGRRPGSTGGSDGTAGSDGTGGTDGGAASEGAAEPDAPEAKDHPTDPADRVAPTADPSPGGRADGAAGDPAVAKRSRAQRRKEWRQEERARRYAARRSVRFPIFTRAVLLWMVVFALFGLAFGASGAFWWAHFNTQISEIREETRDIESRSTEALAQIEAERNAALTEIDQSLEPLAGFLSEARTIQLAQVFAPAVWFVATLDEEGRPAVGSAFAVSTTPDSSLMVTSFSTVKAASVNPAPEITLRNGSEEVVATLVNFDADRDLALLSVPRGDLAVIEWANDDQQAKALGSRVFPVSGFGGAGASLTSGIVIDQNGAGFLHDARIGLFMQGGPIVTSDGKVIGVASVDYRPLGFDPGEVHFSVSVNALCEKLLDCGGGARKKPDAEAPPQDPAEPPP